MRDNPEAVAAPVEQPGMASKGDGTLGKGMGRDKVSLPLWVGAGWEIQGKWLSLNPRDPGAFTGTCHPAPAEERAAGRWMYVLLLPAPGGRVLWAE